MLVAAAFELLIVGQCGPIELVMIQQQRNGGSLMGTTRDMIGQGHIFRSVFAMMAREGIYCE